MAKSKPSPSKPFKSVACSSETGEKVPVDGVGYLANLISMSRC
ncbi:hypothetical protein O9929_04500 [Vibrio lentus]|nr:hypothetical protein [Vibrio lentus]